MSRPRPAASIAVFLLVVMVAASCASRPGSAKKLTPYQLVSSAVAKTSSAKTARISMVSRLSGPEEMTMNGTGVVDLAGKRGFMTMRAEGPSQGSLELEMVFDGVAIYEKLPPEAASQIPGGKRWIKIDLDELSKNAGLGFDPGELIQGSPGDATHSLQFLLGASRNVTDLGTEKVRGVSTSHYRLVLDMNKVVERVPDAARNSYRTVVSMLESPMIPAEVWIDEKGLLRKMTFTETIASGPGAPEGKVTLHMTIEYYDFGVPVDVQAPPASDVVDIIEILEQSPSP